MEELDLQMIKEIKTIGIITPKKQFFDAWIKNHFYKYVDDNVIHIQEMKNVLGRRFDEIVFAYKSYEVDEDVVKQAEEHLKSNIWKKYIKRK